MFSKTKTNGSLLVFLFLLTVAFVYAQTQQKRDAEVLINSVTEKAGENFKEGLLALQDNLRPQAREKFDRALEVFLMSTLNVQRNPKLQDCYNQLVDTIYLIEFPKRQKPPQIAILSVTCGWNINAELANDIATLVLRAPLVSTDDGVVTTNVNAPTKLVQGFTEQEFEPSNLDDLTNLELTQEEKDGRNFPNRAVLPTKTQSAVRVVKARSGDTVSTLAARERVSAVEVAKFNGLLPGSKLAAGREIKIPIGDRANSKSASSATQCNLTVRNAPTIRGLNLGMSPTTVSRILGIPVITERKKEEISFKKNDGEYVRIYSFENKSEYEKNKREFDLGEERFTYFKRQNAVSSKLAGIRSISMKFYKKSLYHVYISYDPKDIRWGNLKEFVSNISDKLNLPLNSWKIDEAFAFLSCKSFNVGSSFTDLGVDLLLINNAISKEIESDARERYIELDKKENTADYEKKKLFKP